MNTVLPFIVSLYQSASRAERVAYLRFLVSYALGVTVMADTSRHSDGYSIIFRSTTQADFNSSASSAAAFRAGFLESAVAIPSETAFSTAPSVTPLFTAFLTVF
jgi:hypothetical protein